MRTTSSCGRRSSTGGSITPAIPLAASITTLSGSIALGSTNEVFACLDVGAALGYCELDPQAEDKLGHVRATLLNLVKPKR